MRTVWTAYRRMEEDFDSRDVEAESDDEAAAIARRELYLGIWPSSLRDDLVIDSQEVVAIPERRYHLDLASDALDLGLEEAN